MGNLEEMEKKSQAIDMLIDMLAEGTGDQRFVFVKKNKNFMNKCHEISMDKKVKKEKFEKLNNLIDQFTKLIDDVMEDKKDE